MILVRLTKQLATTLCNKHHVQYYHYFLRLILCMYMHNMYLMQSSRPLLLVLIIAEI